MEDEMFSIEEEETTIEEAVEEAVDERTQILNQDLIPSINPSYFLKEETARFSTAGWFNALSRVRVSLLGVGGIGSYVAYLLSRLGINRMDIWDMDILESVNMSGQLHSAMYIGQPKVKAMVELLRIICNNFNINAVEARFIKGSGIYPIVICGFDNMVARKDAFNTWVKQHKESPTPLEYLFIDGRLAAEEFQVYCVQGGNLEQIEQYKETLFTDAEAEETVCSYKQTAFCANMIASVMVNCLINFLYNANETIFERPVPYFTRYSAETMIFKTE